MVSKPWATWLAALLLTLLFGWRLPTLQVDNTPEVWLPDGSERLRELKRFRTQFGEDSVLLAYVTGENLVAHQDEWTGLVKDLRAIPGIGAVFAPPFVESESDGPPVPLRYYLVSEDGKHAAVALLPRFGLPAEERGQLVDRLEAVLTPRQAVLGTFHLAGPDVITKDLDLGSRTSLVRLAPLVLGAMCFVLYAATREWVAVAVSLFAIVMGDIWALGILAWTGGTLNLVVVTMPAILAVTTMTQAMHLVAYYHDLPVPAPGSAASQPQRAALWWLAVKNTFWPNFWCAISTAAGFASLGTSQIPPISTMGLTTAVGVMLAFGLCYTLVPALLSLSSLMLPRGVESHPWWTRQRAQNYVAWLRRRGGAVITAVCVLFLVALGGLRLLRAEAHVLEMFSPGDRIPVNYHAIEDNLLALTPIEIVVEGAPAVLLTDATFGVYKKLLEDTLAAEPLIHEVVSLVLEPTRGRKLEFAVEPAELREALATEGLPEGAGTYLRVEDGRYLLRTTLLAATTSSAETQAVMDRLRSRMAASVPPDIHAYLTGSSTQLIEGQVLLLKTQLWSFASAFAAIALVILVGFRSWTCALIALPPSIVPIALTLGMMGFLGIALDTVTVTVAGIALGLLVDDTIHILFRWREHRQKGKEPAVALADALYQIGNPAVMTSMAFSVGFGMFALAPFRPTVYFGLLIAVTAFTGLFCDVVLLPALLLRRRR